MSARSETCGVHIRVGIMLYAKLKKALPRSAFLLEQGTGIEPACLGWEPSILPMN